MRGELGMQKRDMRILVMFEDDRDGWVVFDYLI